MKNKYLFLALGFLGLIALGFGVYTIYNNMNRTAEEVNQDDLDEDDQTDLSVITANGNDIIDEESFSLYANYTENNTWEYSVEGYLPNPCYDASVEAIVAESFPEQVTVKLNVIAPAADIVCTQVIEDFVFDSSFSASEQATVKFEVTEN